MAVTSIVPSDGNGGRQIMVEEAETAPKSCTTWGPCISTGRA